MKIRSLILAGITTALFALPASALEGQSGSAARNYSPAGTQLAQFELPCVRRCKEGCAERNPAVGSASYNRCFNKCQNILCAGR